MAVNIVIRTDFDAAGIKEAERGLQKLGDFANQSFRAVAVATGVAAAAFGKFALDSIRAASNLEESTNAVNVSFGKSAEAILAIGENSAESLGLAQTEFNQAAVRFSAFADRIAGDGGDTAKVIQDLSQRAADFASVFNIDVAEALRVFQSGLAGEAEPLKRFGINLLDSEVKAYALANGITAVGEQMTETQKVQARFGLLMQSTAKTAGDFANTSDGLANSQRILKAQFTDLQAEIGNALLPAFTELVKAVGDALMPRLEELGQFLNSPQGKKMIEDTAKTVMDMVEAFIELAPTIAKVGAALFAFTGTIKLAQTALSAVRLAQLAFNVAVATNPYVLAATALLAFVTAMVAFSGEAEKNKLAAQSQSYQVQILTTEIERLNDVYKSGAIDQQTYENQLRVLEQRLNSVKVSTEATAGELNRFNKLRLDGAIASINEFKNATSLAERQARSFSDSYAYLESIGAVTRRVTVQTDFSTTGTGTGKSPAELAAEQLEKVQGIIKKASDAMWDAQRNYQERVTSAQATFQKRSAQIADQFTEDVVRATAKRNEDLEAAFDSHTLKMIEIEQEANSKLAEIIMRSKNSLRDAYRTATQLSINEVLSDFNKAEEARKKAFEDARSEAEKNKEAFNEQFMAGDPVAALRDTLANQVASNKKLAEQSAALFSAGFSQTFIEQMIQAGDEGSMVVADALLAASPETRQSIQTLFDEIETQSQTGLDALADQIYETAGLATKELQDLYALTEAELIVSLEAQRLAYADQVARIQEVYQTTLSAVTDARNAAMADAHGALVEEMRAAEQALRVALDAIEKEFRESIAALDGNLAGLTKTIDALLSKFNALRSAAGQSTAQVVAAPPTPAPTPTPAPVTGALAGFTNVGTLSGSAIDQATGILIDSASDLQKVMSYLAERAAAAQRFASLEAKTPEEAANARMMATLFGEQIQAVNALYNRPDKGVGTVININVKADTSQSLAMVGKSLGNTVAKYVTGGGQVIVSPV